MKEFDMHDQYAGFYQNAIKRDFVSSKLFIFLCVFTLAISLFSISYFSNIQEKPSLSQRHIASFTPPQLAPVGHYTTPKARSTPAPFVASNEKVASKRSSVKISEALPQKKTDLLVPAPKKLTTEAEKVIANHTPPAMPLPAIPKLDLDQTLKAKKPEKSSSHLAVVEFKIQKSLAKDTKQAGLSRYLSNELTRAFAEKLDLKKIRAGDRFTVLYHKHQSGENVQNDQILAAKYTSKRNKIIKVVRLNEGPHKGNFFSLDKLYEAVSPKSVVSLSLLRKPVKNGRVSSQFQPHRFHPVLKRYRAHLGVDYAAAPGTPIMASGDGKVTFAGRQNGYGNLVIIQHDKKYSTRYGHLAGFAKIKAGSVVKKNQVIGYVGKTGYATGHHVHYEIRINGKAHNPLTVALPNSRKITGPTISKRHHQEIASKAKVLFAKMDELKKKS